MGWGLRATRLLQGQKSKNSKKFQKFAKTSKGLPEVEGPKKFKTSKAAGKLFALCGVFSEAQALHPAGPVNHAPRQNSG